EFGGVIDAAKADAVAEMVDRHLEPGGRFYAYGDDLWFMDLSEQFTILQNELFAARLAGRVRVYGTLEQRVAERRRLVLEAFHTRFGDENVSRAPLRGYGGDLSASGIYTVQIRKPLTRVPSK